MKKRILAIVMVTAATLGASAQDEPSGTTLALRNLNRAMDIADAAWNKTIRGSDQNLYMADTYNTINGTTSGPSDIWPLTAAVEAHCSILEALEAAKECDPQLYERTHTLYRNRLELLIDNLEYYRGTYRLASYATNRECSPYAVPRSATRGGANVSGILNVYDDQMWLARELTRAYRLTDNREYLELATYLADYVIEGWDCWRDEDGNEYGGITWGPGYNSKHACSNGPIIQPLAWLSDIYNNTGEEMDFSYRNEKNEVKKERRLRSEVYLEFAKKVYDWQRSHLLHSSGVYWDMMGADGKIKVSRGYRQHVDCGNPGGAFYSYNTGTMIAGGAELYRITGDERYKTELNASAKGALSQFSRYIRDKKIYDFKTDEKATAGFNTWFNNVLMRAFVDAYPYSTGTSIPNGLNGFQGALDYAFESHNRDNLLPIRLLDGWGEETVTKGFHQFSFVSEYAMLAVKIFKESANGGLDAVSSDEDTLADKTVYTISGIAIGTFNEVRTYLSPGLYIIDGKKVMF